MSKSNAPGNALFCLEHGGRPIDVWYDCEHCLEEAAEWATAKGFTQCVSPYITREGSDNGEWVKSKQARWQMLEWQACTCGKCTGPPTLRV